MECNGVYISNTMPGWRRGVLVKNPKSSRCGSVMGVLCEKAVVGGAGRWWVWTMGTEMTGGLHVCKREVGGQGLGQKPESERLWLDFGCAMWNGGVGVMMGSGGIPTTEI